MPANFFLRNNGGIFPVNLPDFLPEHGSGRNLSFLRTLKGNRYLAQGHLFRRARFNFRAKRNFVNFLCLPIPLLANDNRFLPFLHRAIRTLLSFLNLFPRHFRPITCFLLHQRNILCLECSLVHFLRHDVGQRVYRNLFHREVDFFYDDLFLHLRFFRPRRKTGLHFHPYRYNRSFLHPSYLFFRRHASQFRR